LRGVANRLKKLISRVSYQCGQGRLGIAIIQSILSPEKMAPELAKQLAVKPNLKLQIETLTMPQLENITESLLDFASPCDLEVWLSEQAES
jgi:Domain of unknown function (DUF4351)